MLKIWGRKNSSNVRKVLWCAEEAGLAYERIDAGGAFGVVNDAPYRALNPNGVVPTLEDEGFVLWESNTIVRYLAARYAPDLYPQDLQQRASAEKWMDWTTSSLAAPFRTVFWGTVRTPPEQRDPAASRLPSISARACWQFPRRCWQSSHTCLANSSVSAIFPWAASSMLGSKCPSSARRSRISRPGTSA